MRRILAVTGADRIDFLQGLVTNKVGEIPAWTALLTPQGKYLADFLVIPEGGRLLIDVDDRLADDLLRRLSMYKLRSQVQIAPTDLTVARGIGAGGGQGDLQLGELAVRGRQHQEDQDHQQHVDERDQVDLRLLRRVRAELHRLASALRPGHSGSRWRAKRSADSSSSSV